jgi:hypothetical protein
MLGPLNLHKESGVPVARCNRLLTMTTDGRIGHAFEGNFEQIKSGQDGQLP